MEWPSGENGSNGSKVRTHYRDITDYLSQKKICLVINIPLRQHRTSPAITKGYLTRRMAVEYCVPLVTDVKCAKLLINVRQCERAVMFVCVCVLEEVVCVCEREVLWVWHDHQCVSYHLCVLLFLNLTLHGAYGKVCACLVRSKETTFYHSRTYILPQNTLGMFLRNFSVVTIAKRLFSRLTRYIYQAESRVDM